MGALRGERKSRFFLGRLDYVLGDLVDAPALCLYAQLLGGAEHGLFVLILLRLDLSLDILIRLLGGRVVLPYGRPHGPGQLGELPAAEEEKYYEEYHNQLGGGRTEHRYS